MSNYFNLLNPLQGYESGEIIGILDRTTNMVLSKICERINGMSIMSKIEFIKTVTKNRIDVITIMKNIKQQRHAKENRDKAMREKTTNNKRRRRFAMVMLVIIILAILILTPANIIVLWPEILLNRLGMTTGATQFIGLILESIWVSIVAWLLSKIVKHYD